VVLADLGGRPVAIRADVADVDVRGWSQPGLEVTIEAAGTRAAPDSVDAAVEETPEVVRIHALAREGSAAADLRTRIIVRVPAAARVTPVGIGEGSLALGRLQGEVQARVARGRITGGHLSGVLRLETESGPIELADVTAAPDGLIRLRTFAGHLVLGLVSRPTDARILALTLGGTIRSDVPLHERAGSRARLQEAVLGRGQPLISLDTVQGDIVLTVPPD
jgi:hypothetical protein